MIVRFALVAEGTSDHGLITHLEALCVAAGAQEASGSLPALDRLRPPPGRDVSAQVDAALGLDPYVDAVFFVHRDADSPSPTSRRHVIQQAFALRAPPPLGVPVVPVQELEAWLLTDESEIRSVVGRSSGRRPLGLPRLRDIELTPDPKQVLKDALVRANEASGRRLDRIKKDFPTHRAILLERLDRAGPVRQLTAWQQLERDIASLIASLRAG